MYRFIKDRSGDRQNYSQNDPVNRIEVSVDSEADLDEMLEAFKSFLLAAGYSINGDIEVVENEYRGASFEGVDFNAPAEGDGFDQENEKIDYQTQEGEGS